MSVEEENKARQRRVWEEVLNQGNFDIIPELIDENWVEHTPWSDITGIEGFKQGPKMMQAAFPDCHATIDDIFGEGDRVVSRVTVTGTFQNEYMGIAPTGKKFSFRAIVITHWVDGKEVETWSAWDRLSMYQEMGINPTN